MKLLNLKQIVPILQKLKTTTLTGEEDLVFLLLWDEIDSFLNSTNETVQKLIKKYEIEFQDNSPIKGDIDKFNEAYSALQLTEFKAKNKLDFETIRKIKNENALEAWVFKIFSEEF